MTTPRAPPVLLLLLWVLLAGARAGDGDFDLADALDDPEPTSKPSGGLYPKLPQDPAAPDPHGGGESGARGSVRRVLRAQSSPGSLP
ncbi:glycoprotein Xg isoform X2 [Peromyscus californicus insignis]|uniref:glycoprotein Xg isoform X2 n=1 Tax=Peromyscus californicus insignis TaxID=564181 RepID=UPI0022A70169|nr:glycoprotein Xg isoform X2 [Peromyscus californicus insignis]